MKIIVTGGAGFVGSNLALSLDKSHDVTVIYNLDTGTYGNLIDFFNVGTGKKTSFNEILFQLSKVMGTKLEPDFIEDPYAFFHMTCADISKIAGACNFKSDSRFQMG